METNTIARLMCLKRPGLRSAPLPDIRGQSGASVGVPMVIICSQLGMRWLSLGCSLFSSLLSLDQTTRLHGEVKGSWCELARPQVHGYDLVGVTFLSPLRFASIADEKVARVFEAPRGFVRMVKDLGVADPDVDEVIQDAFCWEFEDLPLLPGSTTNRCRCAPVGSV